MDKDLIILVAVGDICLGAGVRDSIRQFGSDFPFAQCRSILHGPSSLPLSEAGEKGGQGEGHSFLQNADVVFGNLEMVLYEKGTPLKENHLDFKAPLHYGEGLKRAGFRVLSVANNHILDFGAQACRDTLNFLKRQGIQTVGCGETLSEARKPAILTVRGKRIGFLAYAEDVGQSAGPKGGRGDGGRGGRGERETGRCPPVPSSLTVPRTAYHGNEWFPLSHSPLVSSWPCVAPIKRKYLVEDIRALQQQVDLIVVSLHADLEFLSYPAPWRVRLSRQLIDAGADLVLQHHPHVPQGVERYGKGMIIYSLGSFVFPVYGNSYANHPYTDQSFVLRVWMGNRKGLAAEPYSRALQPSEPHTMATSGFHSANRIPWQRVVSIVRRRSDDANDNEIVGAEFLPVRINRFHQPVPLVGEDRQKFLMELHKISLPLHDLEFLDRFWAINCRRSLCIHWSWLKEAYWDMGWRGVLHRLMFLARTSENRRWLLGLLPGLVRFGFWDNL